MLLGFEEQQFSSSPAENLAHGSAARPAGSCYQLQGDVSLQLVPQGKGALLLALSPSVTGRKLIQEETQEENRQAE